MPPLIYDANAKVQPEIDPKMIVLVRRVGVRPTLIFQGRVEGVAIAAVAPAPPPASIPAAGANAPKPEAPVTISLSIVSAISSANCGRVAPNPLSWPYLDCLPGAA